ncbi:hypothetical protein H0H81_007239 [Sphagnurus paluster]|uniref:KOW domain-containing protein n=1 Tax=Sphagnurus paluster TaxID=117069 RepID=A0A9P7KDK3_9AGAR|nr:hypothetical protein H0H81_007239 [Sphagnurus paluster]
MMRQIWGNSSVKKRNQTYIFQGQEFKDGHLSIDGNGVNIYTEEAIPTAEEIALFKNNPSVQGSAVEEAVRRMSMWRLQERDWVKVTVGEYQVLVGIAKNISTDEVIIFVPEQHVEVTVALNQLRKYTKVGDEVKVIFGPHTGAEGWVVAVDTADNVAVFDPKTVLEITVSSNHVQFFELPVVKQSYAPLPPSYPSLPDSSTSPVIKNRNHQYIGKYVKIIKHKQFKNYNGFVASVLRNNFVRVEIHARRRAESIHLSNLVLRYGSKN